jgi:hypothetical protein
MDLDLNKVYRALQDELSRDLYLGYLNYRSTQNLYYLYQVLLKHNYNRKAQADINCKDIIDLVQEEMIERKNKIVLCGNNELTFQIVSAIYSFGLKISYFYRADEKFIREKFKNSDIFFDVSEIRDNYLPDLKDYKFIIQQPGDDTFVSIFSELMRNKVPRENIYHYFLSPINDPQYFDAEIIRPDKNEIFIDGGCFDFSTSKDFIQWAKNPVGGGGGGGLKRSMPLSLIKTCLMFAERMPKE